MKATNKFFILTLFYLFLLYGCTQEQPLDPKDERAKILKYKIKSISEYITRINLGIPEKERIDHIRFFNQKGYFTREFRYLENEKIDYICNYAYDSHGNILRAKTVKSDSSLVADIEKKYNNKNQMTEQMCTEIAGGPYLYRNTFEYDTAGRMVDCHWYWPTGLRAVEKYFYDGKKKNKCINYGPSGQFLNNWIYKYDDRDNLIETIEYYPDSLVKSRVVCDYDKDNNMFQKTNYIESRVQVQSVYVYDKRGLLTSKTEYSSIGKESARLRYHYEYY